MPDYANGKIYILRSPHTHLVSIGSTTTPLSQRMSKHRSDFKRYNAGIKTDFRTSFYIFQAGDPYIELLENFPCGNVEELCAKEYQYIRDYGENCCNKLGAFVPIALPPTQTVLDLMNILATE
jgi:hypothetical protein